ncbi:SGNH/GDSL hydrolase family protein [Acinetobacter modestus]|nr:SGNH/GDSL hydrolase family protein [Acinetobacter modestus]
MYFYIAGSTQLDQLLDITNYDNFYPDAIERALDKLTALLQEWGTLLSQEKQERILADISYDSLALEREDNLENRLTSYINAVMGITNPAIFDGISDRMIITGDGRTQREFNNTLPYWTDEYANFKQETFLREEALADHFNAELLAAGNTLNISINTERTRALAAEAVLQTNINSIGVGNKAYLTYADMNADKASIPNNSKVDVTADSTSSNNGTWQYSTSGGGTFTKSLYDPFTLLKNYVDSNAVFKPVVVNAAIDFNTYKTYGLYYFTSGSVWDSSTNRPGAITNTWAYMLVLPISATVVAQYIWCLNTLKMTYRYCNSSNVWSAWSIFSDDATLTTSILAAADPIIATKISTTLTPMFNAAGKNKFDKSTILTGFVISGSGVVNSSATGVITSLINIKGATSIAISGLQVSVGYRAVRFLREDKTVISVTSVAPGATTLTPSVPTSTVYVQFTLKETADTFTLNPDTVQLESGTSATAFEAYVRGNLTSLYGVSIEAASSVGNIKSAAIGAKYLLFGDSITQTSNVDSGVFNQTSYFTQWPTYAYAQLQMTQFRNYAKSGASFRNRSLLPYQYLGYQVEQAIANNELADVIVVSCGTNDGVASLGDYETAMSKSTQGSLDTTLLYEAARYAFWKIRQKWPNAVCFFCVPLQRASADTTALLPMLDGLTKMAGRYGFTIIDQHRESGIIRDLEVQDAAGVFLADGLHPNAAGKQLQADYICAKIISRMSK